MATTNLWASETLGSFSLDTFAITLAGACPESAALADINGEQLNTLEHEFGHFLHYTNTYLGLRHLSFLADFAESLKLRKMQDETPEGYYSRRAERALLIFRLRQALTIDDEFYFYGTRPDLAKEASTRGHGAWCTSEGIGHLFHTNGEISDRAFWYVKFHLDSPIQERCFARVPGGMRVFLEHMARAIDLAVDCRGLSLEQVASVWNRVVRLSYQPANLHYHSLTHLAGLILEQKFDHSAVPLAPVLAGMLVLYVCEVPFDDTETWDLVRKAAESLYPKLAKSLTHPHPSFIFPLVQRAFLRADISSESIAKLDYKSISSQLDGVLRFDRKQEAAIRLQENLIRRFRNLALPAVSKLLEWSAGHYNALGPGDRLSNPLKGTTGSLPMPILFDDGAIDGTHLAWNECHRLADLHSSIAAQLRYPFVRNIVPS